MILFEKIIPERLTQIEVNKLLEQSIILESERLTFRKITKDDFEDMASMLRNIEVMYAWEHVFSDEEINQWIERQVIRYTNHLVGYFAVIHKDTNEFIGQMGLVWSDFENIRALEIGYILKREFWGNGYAAEGARGLAQYAFTKLGVSKVYATIRPNNKSSTYVAKRIGMHVEGSFIKHYNGNDMEHLIYSISFAQ